MDHQFRNAVFGGFNRQDVLDYLETLARENAQKRQELEQSIGRAEGERDELCAQKQALEEQKRALEGEKEELLRSVQRSQSELAALRTQLGEREQTARQTQQALEESRREAEALREQVARLEPDAAAYAAVKDRSAGVELEAHRRAQGVLDQANSQARASAPADGAVDDPGGPGVRRPAHRGGGHYLPRRRSAGQGGKVPGAGVRPALRPGRGSGGALPCL